MYLNTTLRFYRPRDRPYGVLAVYDHKKRDYAGDDINFIQAVANMLAAALGRKAAEEKIKRLAYHDSLTKLPNRKLLKDRFKNALAQAERNRRKTALLYLDLDQFKRVNEQFGHDIGDRLLAAFARRLNGVLEAKRRGGGFQFNTRQMESRRAA